MPHERERVDQIFAQVVELLLQLRVLRVFKKQTFFGEGTRLHVVLVAAEVLTNRSTVAFYGLNLILIQKLVEAVHLYYVLLKFLFVGRNHVNEFV